MKYVILFWIYILVLCDVISSYWPVISAVIKVSLFNKGVNCIIDLTTGLRTNVTEPGNVINQPGEPCNNLHNDTIDDLHTSYTSLHW